MDKVFDAYIQKVERYLKPLPQSERSDILKEIGSQIMELESAGLSQTAICERLGSPKKLARSYLALLINDHKTLLRNKLPAICAYYMLAGLMGMIIIPILLVCAAGFVFCAVVTPLVSLLKLLDYLFNLGLPYMDHVAMSFGSLQLNPVWAFVISLPLAAALFAVAWACWKLLLSYVTRMKQVKRYMSSDAK